MTGKACEFVPSLNQLFLLDGKVDVSSIANQFACSKHLNRHRA